MSISNKFCYLWAFEVFAVSTRDYQSWVALDERWKHFFTKSFWNHFWLVWVFICIFWIYFRYSRWATWFTHSILRNSRSSSILNLLSFFYIPFSHYIRIIWFLFFSFFSFAILKSIFLLTLFKSCLRKKHRLCFANCTILFT